MYLKSINLKNFRKFYSPVNFTADDVDEVSNIINFTSGFVSSDKTSISNYTTLIIGKNNSGKTTIVTALEFLLSEKKLYGTDFNMQYLKEYICYAKENYDELVRRKIAPEIEFEVKICIPEDEQNSGKDILTNLLPFVKLGTFEIGDDNEEMQSSGADANSNDGLETDIIINIKYALKNEVEFYNKLKKIISNSSESSDNDLLKKFIEMLNDLDFGAYYSDDEGNEVNFKLKSLIDLKLISANKIKNDKSLSDAFTKIIKYRFDNGNYNAAQRDEINIKIENINMTINEEINTNYAEDINENFISKMNFERKIKVLLNSNLTFDKVLNNLIEYQYSDNDTAIPESQFGLGYTNIVMIVAEMLDYVEQYPDSTFNSKVNLISIEEPETFMHPQMQEMFIKNIDIAISTLLLKNTRKNINSQLIITTHSSHILNSKIHEGNTFDNMVYLTNMNNNVKIVNLNDGLIMSRNITSATEDKQNNLKFLKTHIKYKVSEMFFADAVIFVEGITEESILPYYIDIDENMCKYYITLMRIDGAHAQVYYDLIQTLKIPCLIITDLDIKRDNIENDDTDKKEKDISQITSLVNCLTTNNVIISNNINGAKLDDIETIDTFTKENLKIVFQTKTEGFYPSSFEEALILENFNNEILKNSIKDTHPIVYNNIREGKDENLKDKSYKLQNTFNINKSKSIFSSNLTYNILTTDDFNSIPKLPEYIKNGFDWLIFELEGGAKHE